MDRPTITGDAISITNAWLMVYLLSRFAAQAAHATSVCASFNAAGDRAKLVTGNMPMEERMRQSLGLADGRTQVLCSVDVVSEGTDVPAVSTAILLRPTQSEALYLQQVGRILRPQPGKIAIVLDHVGSTLKHGFIDDVRPWSLEAASQIGTAVNWMNLSSRCKAVLNGIRCRVQAAAHPVPCCGHGSTASQSQVAS